MDSSSRTSRFKFRDHQETENSLQSDSSSNLSSVASSVQDDDQQPEPKSMTGKGIERLCNELVELKAASEEDFYGSIFGNYSVFVRIFAEVESIENEVLKLKTEVSAHKGLVNDLHGIYLKFLSVDPVESTLEEEAAQGDGKSTPSELMVRINNVSEKLDTLLSENKIDEAISLIEMEEENLQKLKFEDNSPVDVVELYASTISEKRVMLTLQLTLVAESSRTVAAEFQKVLSGLCRLGDSHLATQLLTNYYRSRISTGICNVYSSKPLVHGVYIRELARFVFSTISQAARSFVMLYGETSPFASELISWVSEEIELFASLFNNYIKSISDISGGLATVAEAVKITMWYCTLLESQRLILRPWLIEHVQPSVKEVLQVYIAHFRKVIGISVENDTWVLGRYLVSGIMTELGYSTAVSEQLECCFLTSSGRKFVTLLQAIEVDISPLFSLQIEGPIVRGFIDLFIEYISILERAITKGTNDMGKADSKVNLPGSLQKQVSLLANLPTVEDFLSTLVTRIFRKISCADTEPHKNQSNGNQDTELDACIMVVHDTSAHLRSHFFNRYIHKLMSLKSGHISMPETCNESRDELDAFHSMKPSFPFRVLFIEMRKLTILAEDNVFEVNWFIELVRELIEAIFVWTTTNMEFWEVTEANSSIMHFNCSPQFILDMHFLVETAKYGRYFRSNPSSPVLLMKAVFKSIGLEPDRHANVHDSATKAAAEAIQRLLEIDETNLALNEDSFSFSEEEMAEKEYESARESVQTDGNSPSEESLDLNADTTYVDGGVQEVMPDS